MSSCYLLMVWRQHEVAVDDHTHRKSRPDCERWLNIQIPADDPLPDLIKTLRSTAPDCLDEIVLIAAGAGFGSDAEQGRGHRRLEERTPMVIDLILKA